MLYKALRPHNGCNTRSSEGTLAEIWRATGSAHNIEAPAGIADSKLGRRLAARRDEGGDRSFRIDLSGQAAQCAARDLRDPKRTGQEAADRLCRIVHPRRRRGRERFFSCAVELGVSDDVIVSGYIAFEHEVFGVFSQIDAFCYPFDEGLTARRASILGCVQSGRPVVVSGPAEPDEFDHHPRFKELIDRGAVVLVGRGSGGAVYADRIISALKWPSVQTAFDFNGWWEDVARAVLAQL